ncbi:hypothetical protein A2U01_0109242, partial [Trifolium medium]|nr:hypothetical protein [Trifolium medium]
GPAPKTPPDRPSLDLGGGFQIWHEGDVTRWWSVIYGRRWWVESAREKHASERGTKTMVVW